MATLGSAGAIVEGRNASWDNFARRCTRRVITRTASQSRRCRWDDEYRFGRPIQLHNAYDFESVTIYYRWHPLCGLSCLFVRVEKTATANASIASQTANLSLPSWMLSHECSQFSLGPPLISAEALVELRELLASLRLHADCDKASPHSSPKEGIDETIGKAALSADESSALQYAGNRNADDQQKDLTFALMELLIRAAGKNEQPGNGGEDESETHA